MISRNFGGRVRAYQRTDHEARQPYHRIQVATLGGGRRVEYLVAPPGRPMGYPAGGDSSPQWWQSFGSYAELRAWVDAYGLGLPAAPEPGTEFDILLPPDDNGFQPLT